MNKTLGLGLLLTTAALSTLGGCAKETISSENLKTAGIAATFEAESSNGTDTRLRATLQAGGDESNTYVLLATGDALSASDGTDTKNMSAESTGIFEAEFSTAAAGTTFSATFTRDDGVNAEANSGVMPDPFSITEVPTTTPSRETEDIVVKWDNGGSGSMSLEVDGPCIFNEDIDVATGQTEYTIRAGTLKSTGGDTPETCDISVKLTRQNSGTVDSAWDAESSFRLRQIRSQSFASAP